MGVDVVRKFSVLTILGGMCIVCCFKSSATAGDTCPGLDGRWYDESGAELVLIHTVDGTLTGNYSLSSSSSSCSGSDDPAVRPHQVVGTAPYNNPTAVFGFSVLLDGDSSMTSWTGQCLVCDGAEMLETSWLLRRRHGNCSNEWRSTLIGQMTFTRDGSSTNGARSSRVVRQASSRTGLISRNTETRTTREKRASDEVVSRPCLLNGYWYNELGSEMFITTHSDNTIIGEYRTAVERHPGAAGSSHSMVYGHSNTSDPHSAIALYVVWNDGKSITGWVGQCQLCGVNQTEIVLMTWLLRSQITSCDDNWKSTMYGSNTFTRHEQRTSGPRRSSGTHTPGQAGEPDMTSSAPPATVVVTSSCDVGLTLGLLLMLAAVTASRL